MMKWLGHVGAAGVVASIAIGAVGPGTTAARDSAPPGGPVVVELFTSEGCSSCPPADEWLRQIAETRSIGGVPVILLSEHVDYWNRLGWKDPFSSASITARQNHYAASLGSDVYTPQMVVDGEVQFVGSDQRAATTAIGTAAVSRKAVVAADLRLVGSAIDVHARVEGGPLGALPDADVFFALTEDGLTSNVGAGENQGRRILHAAVTRDIRRVGRVKKGSATADLEGRIPIEPSWALEHSHVLVLVQVRDGVKIVGAWSGTAPLKAETRFEGR
jgi:hypothetical protein